MAQVINTNSLSLLTQNNLNKSQGALNSAIERLSSGMRINSAKDDAAGQAIANRFTANIKGLTQAQRNANDGISLAQTTEGALAEVNTNLQRIRELAVQSANGANSADDKASIQAEISQRLAEIDRTSQQTDFNGVKVLSSAAGKLNIQVGANDGQTIQIDLSEISSKTLGLTGFNLEAALSSKSMTAAGTTFTLDAPVDTKKTAVVAANAAVAVPGTVQAADGIYALSSGNGFVVKGADDGKYYALEKNAVTDKWQWDSNTGAVDATTVDGSAVATSLPVQLSDVGGTYATMITAGGAPTDTNATPPKLADGATDFESDGALYKLNTGDDSATGTTNYAIKGNDGKFYAATVTLTDEFAADGTTAGTDGVNDTFTVSFDSSALVEVSAGNVIGGNNTVANTDGALTDIRVDDETPVAGDDLLNVATSPADTPTANGLYAVTAGGYAVKGSDGAYYKATVNNTTGGVTWDSSSNAAGNKIASGDVGAAAVTDVVTGSVATATATGLSSGETLQKYTVTENGVAETKYAVKGTDTDGNTYYHAASINTDGTSVDAGKITKDVGADGSPVALTVDATTTLDNALKIVDTLRGSLGAVQNRFDSVISNLGTTIVNLSSSRSRIEDADYATEVSNMTRANILQQAGTSVLAQANQTTQGVLSLLR